MPPVRIKLPVPLGLTVISTLTLEPMDSIEALLLILRPVSGAPIDTVSLVESTERNGVDAPKALSTLILFVVSISAVPIFTLAVPPVVIPKLSAPSL